MPGVRGTDPVWTLGQEVLQRHLQEPLPQSADESVPEDSFQGNKGFGQEPQDLESLSVARIAFDRLERGDRVGFQPRICDGAPPEPHAAGVALFRHPLPPLRHPSLQHRKNRNPPLRPERLKCRSQFGRDKYYRACRSRGGDALPGSYLLPRDNRHRKT